MVRHNIDFFDAHAHNAEPRANRPEDGAANAVAPCCKDRILARVADRLVGLEWITDADIIAGADSVSVTLKPERLPPR
jgi:hypothetical protein